MRRGHTGATNAGGGHFPCADIGVPAAVVFPAFDLNGGRDFGTGLQRELVDFVTSKAHADLAGVLTLGLEDEFLFAPAVSTPARARYFRQHLNNLSCYFHNIFD